MQFYCQLISETLILISPLGKGTFYPDLDDEIDYLHSVIEKQSVSEFISVTKQPKHPGKKLKNNLKTQI